MNLLAHFLCWLQTGHRDSRFGWKADRWYTVCHRCGFESPGVPVVRGQIGWMK